MYFVTTLKILNNEIVRKRTVGFSSNLELLENALNCNSCDIYECGYYNYAVIESIEEGFYNYDLNPSWFKWDNEKQGFYKCSKPDIDSISEETIMIATIG